jgi:formiminotetrahydrofolate cyclodeaminase
MVAGITWPKTNDVAMIEAGRKAQDLKRRFLDAADRDTAAFESLMGAFRLPRSTDEERATRERAIVEATLEASRVPLQVLERCRDVLELCELVASDGVESAVTDAAVGAACALAAAEGASLNVRVNLAGLEQSEETAHLEERRADALVDCRDRAERVLDLVSGRI